MFSDNPLGIGALQALYAGRAKQVPPHLETKNHAARVLQPVLIGGVYCIAVQRDF